MDKFFKLEENLKNFNSFLYIFTKLNSSGSPKKHEIFLIILCILILFFLTWNIPRFAGFRSLRPWDLGVCIVFFPGIRKNSILILLYFLSQVAFKSLKCCLLTPPLPPFKIQRKDDMSLRRQNPHCFYITKKTFKS